MERFPTAQVIVTLGVRGLLYRAAGSRYTHGIYDVTVADTTAAGDTFTGFFLGSLAAGKSIPEGLELGSLASGLAVSVMGASDSIPNLDAVLAARKTLKYVESLL